MKMMVTGGAGFIGSNFVHHMCKEHEIIVYDKLTYAGNIDNLLAVKNEITFIKGDICDEKNVMDVMDKCNCVVHFAAETHVDRSINSSSEFIKTNVLGTEILLKCARVLDTKKFIHISTDEVYGSRVTGFSKEGDSFKPSSPYSASKVGGDAVAQSYYATYGLPVVIVRPSNNFGKYQFPEKLIPFFVTNLIRGKKVPVYGKGDQIRSWLHVDDTCKGLEILIERGKSGEVYNIGSKYEEKNINVTKKILKIMGASSTQIEHVEDRLGHDFRYGIDSAKLGKLGWEQEKDFDVSLNETVEWYRNNELWWRDLI